MDVSSIAGTLFVLALSASLLSWGLDVDVGFGFVLASQMRGTVVDKDMRPVPNVRVERTWEWPINGRKGAHVRVTDAYGNFEFPRVRRFSLLAFLPSEPCLAVDIKAHGRNGPVELLSLQKKNYTDRSETDGKPFNVVFNIDAEPGTSAGGYWGTVVEVR